MLFQSHNLVIKGLTFMTLIVIWQRYGDAHQFVTMVSDIQEVMPFDYLHFNELVHTEPKLSKE